MTTLTRLQAFYWSERLGSLDAAADRLHVTPSAIGKRLQELQAEAAVPLFQVVRKGLKLTAEGHELMRLAELMMVELGQLDALKTSALAGARTISVGVTEITVMTWFRDFIGRLKSMYPDLIVVPHVDLSATLSQRLESGYLDFAILPEEFVSADMASLRLGNVDFDWLCKPGMLAVDEVVPLSRLKSFPLIDQGPASGITTLARKLMREVGIEPERESGSNSMVALMALLEAGLGVSCMPSVVVQGALRAGRLVCIRTEPVAPSIAYHAVFLNHHNPSIGWTLAGLARACCNYSRLA